jgi:hypothetical protein
LENPPTGANIDTNGVITWTPGETQGPGVFTLKTIVADNGLPQLKTTNSFTVTVNEVNLAPVLPTQTDRTVSELILLTVTNTATDADLPANVLTYSLENPPTGANIDTNGVITWTPGETQGPGVFTLKTIVADNGSPQLKATNSFTVTVTDVNNPPTLAPLLPRTVAEGESLTVTNSASDPDTPSQTLTYSLEGAVPTGMVIQPADGLLTWTPTEAQGPGEYPVTIRVTDNGTPPLSATQPLTVTVLEVNRAPQLAPIADASLVAGQTLYVTNGATDADLPTQSLTFSLISAPPGATVNPGTGFFTWRPAIAQSPSTNPVVVHVSDGGSPNLGATQSFLVRVLRPAAPTLSAPTVITGRLFVTVSGDTGPDYVMERVTNNSPTGWLSLTTNQSPALPFVWLEAVPLQATQGLYRVRLLP